MLWYLTDLYLDCMSINVYCHIYNFGFIYENNNIFLSNYHIWNYRNLNSHISQTHWDILLKLSGVSIHFDYSVWNDRRLKAKIVKVPKFAFSGVGLLSNTSTEA